MSASTGKVERAVKRGGHRAERTARKTAANPWLVTGFRAGYVVRGLLYAGMGLGALSLALGRSGHGSDQKASLALVTGTPVAVGVLLVVAVALALYSTWGFVRALLDPLHRGGDAPGIVERLGFAWSGIAYASLLVVVLQVLSGRHPDLHADSVQGMVATALRTPAGRLATGVSGAVGVLAGAGQFIEAWRAGFRRDLKKAEMEPEVYATAVALGRFGMLSRGVIFVTTGWCVLLAAWKDNWVLARGFGLAFDGLLAVPLGHILVGVLGVGFIALALHSIANALWIRIPQRYA